jgi:hypothetical protein
LCSLLIAAGCRPGSIDYLIAGGADHKAGEADHGDIRLKPLKEGQRVRRSPPDEREILSAAFWTVRLSF